MCLVGIAVATMVTAGCPRTDGSAADSRLEPAYDETTGRLKRLDYDSNGDGTMDTFGYMNGARVMRVEADENHDGRIDRWEFHTRGGADEGETLLQTVERVERSTRHDGQVSRWEYFDAGVLSRVEEDTTGDGKVDKWESYSTGTLASLSLDTTGDGLPDRQLLYRPDGSLERIETGVTPAEPRIPSLESR